MYAEIPSIRAKKVELVEVLPKFLEVLKRKKGRN